MKQAFIRFLSLMLLCILRSYRNRKDDVTRSDIKIQFVNAITATTVR